VERLNSGFDQNWARTGDQHTVAIDREKHQRAGRRATLPLTQYPAFNYAALPAGAAATAQIAPYYLDWLAHPSYDAY